MNAPTSIHTEAAPSRAKRHLLLPASISTSAVLHGLLVVAAFTMVQVGTVRQLPPDPADPVVLKSLVLPEPIFTAPEPSKTP
ncbi:MAG: hypothetical protein AAFS10_03125, partial [Myxococcota bacterium]